MISSRVIYMQPLEASEGKCFSIGSEQWMWVILKGQAKPQIIIDRSHWIGKMIRRGLSIFICKCVWYCVLLFQATGSRPPPAGVWQTDSQTAQPETASCDPRTRDQPATGVLRQRGWVRQCVSSLVRGVGDLWKINNFGDNFRSGSVWAIYRIVVPLSKDQFFQFSEMPL